MHANDAVARIMTEAVLSVDVTAPPSEVLRLFTGYPVHHLPVLEGTKVVGMLSSADIMKLDAFLPKQGPQRLEYLDRHMSTKMLMHHPAVTVRGDESVESAAQLMVKHAVHALPVVDAGGNLIGIVTTTDVMYAALYPERRQNAQGAEKPASLAVRLTPSALEVARLAALDAVNAGQDEGGIARAMLQLSSRLTLLENVLQGAERYLRSGQDESLHTALIKAIDRVRREDG